MSPRIDVDSGTQFDPIVVRALVVVVEGRREPAAEVAAGADPAPDESNLTIR